jgi:hypothetical protein
MLCFGLHELCPFVAAQSGHGAISDLRPFFASKTDIGEKAGNSEREQPPTAI